MNKLTTLTVDDFKGYEAKTLVAGDRNTRLWVIVQPEFDRTFYRVEDRKTGKTWECDTFVVAIDRFNGGN